MPLATALARAGRKTALVEREHVGGTCINEGCTPTKTMVASARVAYLARRARDYGVSTGPVTVEMPRVRERKRKIVTEWRTSMQAPSRTNPWARSPRRRGNLFWPQARGSPPERGWDSLAFGRDHFHQHGRAPKSADDPRAG